MPRIKDLSLFVGRTKQGEEVIEFAQVELELEFLRPEASWTSGFSVQATLVEVNSPRDQYNLGFGGMVRIPNHESPDKVVGQIFSEVIDPSQSSRVNISRRKVWEFGELEEGAEEFAVVVTAVPNLGSIKPAIAISDEVEVDLG